MRILLVLIILFVSFPSFASTGLSGFFDEIFTFFNDIWLFFTETIPDLLTRFFVWITTYLLYLKFSLILGSLEFSHSVALSFLDLIDISSVINTAISALPPDLKQVAVDVRFFDSLTLLLEALITRFVYKW